MVKSLKHLQSVLIAKSIYRDFDHINIEIDWNLVNYKDISKILGLI